MKILKFLAKKAGRKPKKYLEYLTIDEKIDIIFDNYLSQTVSEADEIGLYFGFCYGCYKKVPQRTIGRIAKECDMTRDEIRKTVITFLNETKADLIREHNKKKEEIKNARITQRNKNHWN